MIRLYRFDLAREMIDVETFSPYFRAVPADRRTALHRLEVELTGPTNRFCVPIDFTARFGGFDPVTLPPPRPARAVLVRGTVAYWRFDGHRAGTSVGPDPVIRDVSGHGNHLCGADVGGGPEVLSFSDEHRVDQPAHASLRFLGGKDPARGAYLRTADTARLNAFTFDRGYTIEAFVKLPTDFDAAHAWCGVLTRMGTGRDAGKTADDPSEPVATLNLSEGGGAQWAIYPAGENRLSTTWGHDLPLDQWWHLAVVNDGGHAVMYVDGCPVVRNPSNPTVGIATAKQFWMVGAYHYDRVIEQTFHGWLGDIRIVDRPLPVNQFLNHTRRT